MYNGVPSYDALATSIPARGRYLLIAFDARRDQIYYSLFTNKENAWKKVVPVSVMPAAELKATIKEQTTLAGDAVITWQEEIEGIEDLTTILNEESWITRASSIARLGRERYLAGEKSDLYSIAPIYLRPSEAEIKKGIRI